MCINTIEQRVKYLEVTLHNLRREHGRALEREVQLAEANSEIEAWKENYGSAATERDELEQKLRDESQRLCAEIIKRTEAEERAAKAYEAMREAEQREINALGDLDTANAKLAEAEAATKPDVLIVKQASACPTCAKVRARAEKAEEHARYLASGNLIYRESAKIQAEVKANVAKELDAAKAKLAKVREYCEKLYRYSGGYEGGAPAWLRSEVLRILDGKETGDE